MIDVLLDALGNEVVVGPSMQDVSCELKVVDGLLRLLYNSFNN